MQFLDFFVDLTSTMFLWGIGLGALFWAFAKILETWLRIKQYEYWTKQLKPLRSRIDVLESDMEALKSQTPEVT